MTGLGADIMVIDDPMKPEDAATELGRERTIRIFQETLVSRLNNKTSSRILVAMQRLHERDLTGHLLAADGWVHVALSAIATTEETWQLRGGRQYVRSAGEALHAAREPLTTLEQLRKDMGLYTFEAQYQQNPLPAAGIILKSDWITRYKILPDITEMEITQSWDTAYTLGSSSDYSVCTTWGKLRDRHYLIDVFRERLEFPELLKSIIRLWQRDNPSRVLIEDKSSGISLIQQLKAFGLSPIVQKANVSKDVRFNSVMPMFERKEVVFPEHAPWLIELERELLGFPNKKHDDQVDSVSQYLNWYLTKEKTILSWDTSYMYEPLTGDQIANLLLKRRGL